MQGDAPHRPHRKKRKERQVVPKTTIKRDVNLMHPPTLMAVHAHPDDEVFSTGGTLAACAEQGIRTVVIYCTRGEEGELYGGLGPDVRPRLGAIRQAEVREACAELDVQHIAFLGYRDSGMAGSPANHAPDSFWQAPLEEAAWRLLVLMMRFRPDVVITYDHTGGYGHLDHVKANRVTVKAFGLAQNASWAPNTLYAIAPDLGGFKQMIDALDPIYHTEPVLAEVARAANLNPDWVLKDAVIRRAPGASLGSIVRVDVRRFALRKKYALAHHRSQIPPEYFYLHFPDDILPDIQPEETFVRVLPKGGSSEGDLFDGLQRRAAATWFPLPRPA
jgi:LmbE family N-acetylglucosaminyl deacetylase